MSVLLQKIIAFFMAIGTFFAGLFGLPKPVDVFGTYDLPVFTAGIRKGVYESAGGTQIARYERVKESGA